MRIVSQYKRRERRSFQRDADPECRECHGTGEVENTHIGGGDFLMCDCRSEERTVEVETIVRLVEEGD